jgi:hypothetical protein
MKEIKQKFFRSLNDDLFDRFKSNLLLRFDLSNIIFGDDGGIFHQLEYLIC